MRKPTKKMPATSVICTPEMVMMWKMPARRIFSAGVVRRENRACPSPSPRRWRRCRRRWSRKTRKASVLRPRSIAAKKRRPRRRSAADVDPSRRAEQAADRRRCAQNRRRGRNHSRRAGRRGPAAAARALAGDEIPGGEVFRVARGQPQRGRAWRRAELFHFGDPQHESARPGARGPPPRRSRRVRR